MLQGHGRLYSGGAEAASSFSQSVSQSVRSLMQNMSHDSALPLFDAPGVAVILHAPHFNPSPQLCRASSRKLALAKNDCPPSAHARMDHITDGKCLSSCSASSASQISCKKRNLLSSQHSLITPTGKRERVTSLNWIDI